MLPLSLPARLGILLSLYVAQGLPTGIFTQALPAILRSQGVSLSIIGFSGLLALPWALKFLWAPMVDAHFNPVIGQRRSWILPMQAGSILCLLLVALFDPAALAGAPGLYLFFLLMFLVNLFAATQDIATDGLAVRFLGFHERGLGNGVQVAGYRLGLIVGGGLLLFLIGVWDWQLSFLVLAALLVLTSLPVFLMQEPPSVVKDGARHESPWRIYRSFFQRPGMRGWLLVLMTYKVGESLGSAMVKPMLVDLQFDLKQIGLMVSTLGSLATLCGALLGGWLTSRWGRYAGIIGFGVLQALGVASYALISGQHDAGMEVSRNMVYAVNALEHALSGMAMAALLMAVMDLTRPDHAGADFTVQVSLLAIFGGSFHLLAGVVAEAMGYTGYFLFSGVLSLLLLWPAAVFCRRLPLLQHPS